MVGRLKGVAAKEAALRVVIDLAFQSWRFLIMQSTVHATMSVR